MILLRLILRAFIVLIIWSYELLLPEVTMQSSAKFAHYLDDLELYLNNANNVSGDVGKNFEFTRDILFDRMPRLLVSGNALVKQSDVNMWDGLVVDVMSSLVDMIPEDACYSSLPRLDKHR